MPTVKFVCPLCGRLVEEERLNEEHKFGVFLWIPKGRGVPIDIVEAEQDVKERVRRKLISRLYELKNRNFE